MGTTPGTAAEEMLAEQDRVVCSHCGKNFRRDPFHAGCPVVHKCEIEDSVNHPPHYTSHPSGVECITITRHFNFNLGNVIKYLWRAPLKGASLEDLKKARWYLDDEIKQMEERVPF